MLYKFRKLNKVTKRITSAYYVSNIFKEQPMKEKDTYSEVRTIQHGNIVARVHIPDLTPEERAKRLKEIGKIAGQLLANSN